MKVRSCLSPIRPRSLALALVLAAAFGVRTEASPIEPSVYYMTSGWIGSDSQGGASGPIIFMGASHVSNPVSLPGTFSLGNFNVASLGANETLTTNDTPFHVLVNFGLQPPQNGSSSWVTSQLEISGVLNGSIVGNSQSSMVATITSVEQIGAGTLPFPASLFQVLAPLPITPYANNPVKWPTQGGPFLYSLSSQLTAQVSPANPVPEPTTLAILGIGLAGAAIGRRQRAATKTTRS